MLTIKRILPVLTILFLGYLGYSIVLPLFPPLFLDPAHPLLPEHFSTEQRRILLGTLFGMYPIGQFLGAPILGKLSDRYGRKPVLLFSLLAVTPSYIGSALAIAYSLPTLLFFSRFFTGLLEGNVVIAQASITDVSKDAKTKTKNFGWLVSLGSSAFFLGPLIGGSLGSMQLFPWAGDSLPFWGAAILSLSGFGIVYKLFEETHPPNLYIRISLKAIATTLIKGLRFKRLRPIYCANFTLFMGMFFFLNFFSAYLVNRYQFSIARLGEVNAYLALPVMIAPLLFGLFTKWWTSRESMRFGALCLALFLLIFTLPRSPYALFLTLLPIGFFLAMSFAFPPLMVSENTHKSSQGEALGTNQSLQMFAEGLSGFIGGFIMAAGNSYTIYIAALSAAAAATILFIKRPLSSSP